MVWCEVRRVKILGFVAWGPDKKNLLQPLVKTQRDLDLGFDTWIERKTTSRVDLEFRGLVSGLD